MHSLAICTFCQSMDRLYSNPYNSYTEAVIRVKGSLELISMQIFQTLLKYNMQKRRLNSSVNNKSSLHPYLEVETLLLSLLLLRVTDTNPFDFSWQVAMIPNSAKYGPLRRPTATASSQPQCQICTAGRVDQLWTKEDWWGSLAVLSARPFHPEVGNRQNMWGDKESLYRWG